MLSICQKQTSPLKTVICDKCLRLNITYSKSASRDIHDLFCLTVFMANITISTNSADLIIEVNFLANRLFCFDSRRRPLHTNIIIPML